MLIPAAAYQLESVDVRVIIGILNNVPLFQPGGDDAKARKAGQLLQDTEEGKYVGMRDVFPLYNPTVDRLIGIRSSLPLCLGEWGAVTHLFDPI